MISGSNTPIEDSHEVLMTMDKLGQPIQAGLLTRYVSVDAVSWIMEDVFHRLQILDRLTSEKPVETVKDVINIANMMKAGIQEVLVVINIHAENIDRAMVGQAPIPLPKEEKKSGKNEEVLKS